jgi:hypothetical protein
MRVRILLLFLLTACLAAGPALAAPAEQRIALVIGNSAYRVAPLKNPVNDAADIAAALRNLGFEVILRTNASLKEMEEAIREFGGRLKKGGVGLFYFAGHGMQLGGNNFLIPVDARIETESDVKFECVDAGRVLGKMEDAGNSLNIVILDACRNNPFGRGFRSVEQGLAKMDAPAGSLIAYATAPGQIAADGEGRNGIYTKHLLRNISVPGLAIEDALKRVRIGVVEETRKKQIPWESSSMTGYFYFREAPSAPAPGEGKDVAMGAGPKAPPLPAAAPFAPAPNTARLYVNTEPQSAQVKLLNAKARFEQGLSLAPGRYNVAVSAPGFTPKNQWVSLRAGEDQTLNVTLEKVREPAPVSVPPPAPEPPRPAAKPAAPPRPQAYAPYFPLLARDGISEAMGVFSRALDANPDDVGARAGLAIGMFLSGQAADAGYQVRRLEEQGPLSGYGRVAKGLMVGLEGQYVDGSYQLNRAGEEGADRALVALCQAAIAEKKSEYDQAGKALEVYRSFVPESQQGQFAKDLAGKVDILGRVSGTFYLSFYGKTINEYSTTVTFARAGSALTGTIAGYTGGTVSNIQVAGKRLSFVWNWSSGFISGSYTITADLSGDLDTIPMQWAGGGLAGSGSGFLIRQGSAAQALAYQPNPLGCFVATAAYGTPLNERVETLRRFRDQRLATSEFGRSLVSLYYRVSPPAAEWIAKREWARLLARAALAPVVVLAGVSLFEPADLAIAGACLLVLAGTPPVLRRVRRRDESNP